MKFILIKVDKGDVWEITGTTVQTDDFEVDDRHVMEIDRGALFDYIKARLETAQIQFPKNIRGKLIREDLIEINYEPLQIYKERVINQGREYLSTRLNVATLFDYMDFVISNNTLVSHGFSVTPDNKRDMFIKIIESENKDVLDALETYTSVLDKLTVLNGWWKTYKDFEQKVYNSNTTAECDDLYRIFVQIFG